MRSNIVNSDGKHTFEGAQYIVHLFQQRTTERLDARLTLSHTVQNSTPRLPLRVYIKRLFNKIAACITYTYGQTDKTNRPLPSEATTTDASPPALVDSKAGNIAYVSRSVTNREKRKHCRLAETHRKPYLRSRLQKFNGKTEVFIFTHHIKFRKNPIRHKT